MIEGVQSWELLLLQLQCEYYGGVAYLFTASIRHHFHFYEEDCWPEMFIYCEMFFLRCVETEHLSVGEVSCSRRNGGRNKVRSSTVWEKMVHVSKFHKKA